jgi:ABC-type bacteriocin/lantibiotic exporter with double-glycine peptidase domain
LKKFDENFNEEKYYQSIKKSNLLNFVNQLNHKDETILGEFGSTISGGQRQRIGIARALYHDSSILILDEFTSSLDEKTERSVLEDIRLLKKTKTIILSTHKKDILNICDQVYRIDQNKLIKIV